MNQVFQHHNVMVVCIFFVVHFTLGCTTVVPVLPIGADEGHGLLFGNMQLLWNETEASEGFR